MSRPSTTGTPRSATDNPAERLHPQVNGVVREDEEDVSSSPSPPQLPLTSRPVEGDAGRCSVTSDLQSAAETSAETSAETQRDSGERSRRSSGVPGGSPVERGSDSSRDSRASSCSGGGGVRVSRAVSTSSRMNSEHAVPAGSEVEERRPVQETGGMTSPLVQSESDSDFPAGVSSCGDRESRSCAVSSAHPDPNSAHSGTESAAHSGPDSVHPEINSSHPSIDSPAHHVIKPVQSGSGPAQPGSAKLGSSHSIPAGFGRLVLSGSRASSRSAFSPEPAFNRSASHPDERPRGDSTPRGEFNTRSHAAELPTGRAGWTVSEAAPAGGGQRQAVEDQIDLARHCGTDFSPTGQPGINPSGDADEFMKYSDGSPVLSASEFAARSNSNSESHPVHGSPPRQQLPRAASPEEDSVPHGHGGNSGDTYISAGGAACNSFAAWPADGGAGGSPPLLSPLVLFARQSSPPGAVKALCEVADTGTQTDTTEGDDTEVGLAR